MKLLTLNLHCFSEENIELKQKRIVDTILKEDVDVVLLQEVAQSRDSKIQFDDIKEDNYGYNIQQSLLRFGVNYDYHYKIGNQAFGLYDEGLAILSKAKLTDKRHFYISKTIDYYQWNTRVIVSAKSFIEGKHITFTSAHLGWSDGFEVFEDQVDILIGSLNNKDINFIAGDFNISPGSNEYNYLINKGYNDLFYSNDTEYYNIPTHVSDIDQKDGSSRIDYVISNEEFKIVDRKILFNKDLVSDHFGVLIEIEWEWVYDFKIRYTTKIRR